MRGGKRPGAGRPHGSRDKEPRTLLPAGVTVWGRVHHHVADALARDAVKRGSTMSAIVGELIEKNYRCRCWECRVARAEMRRRERAVDGK